MSTEQAAPAALTRRDRARRQTVEDILEVARRLLATGEEELSLRAVARAVGLTAPAIYRYFASYDVLVNVLVARLYDELVATMAQAGDAADPDDVAAQLVASSRAFRSWALDHPREFGAIFANPVQQPRHHHSDADLDDPCVQAGHRFGAYFGQLFVRLWHERGFPAPDPATIEPTILAQLQEAKAYVAPSLPPEALWVFVRQWARLYGAVTMEVFGHLRWAMDDTEAFFTAMLRESLAELGLPADRELREGG